VLYLLAVKLYSPVMAGTGLLAFGLTVVPVSGVVGGVITKLGHYRWALWSGWVFSTLGAGLLVLLGTHTPTAGWIFIFICAGIGQGLLLIAHSVVAQAACETKDVAYASSTYSFFRSFGLCLGVALGGTVFQNFLQRQLLDLGLPLAISSDAEGYIRILKTIKDVTERELVQEAYARAFRLLFATLTGISGLGMSLSLAMGAHSLDKALESEHRLRSSGKGMAVGEVA